MNKFAFWAFMAVLSLGLLTAGTFAAQTQSQNTDQGWSKEYTFGQIVGTSVRNEQGQDLGKISDIVIDAQGHVPFAVLSHGGFWGMGGKSIAIPFTALSFNQNGNYMVLNADQAKLQSAPAFKVSDLSNRKWAEDVYHYFGQQPYWTEEGGQADNSMNSPSSSQPMTGSETNQTR